MNSQQMVVAKPDHLSCQEHDHFETQTDQAPCKYEQASGPVAAYQRTAQQPNTHGQDIRVAMFFLVLALNIFGDRLRDALDPKLRTA